MKARFKFTNPDEMEAEMVLQMTLGEWKRLRGQLSESRHHHPSGQLHDSVASLVKGFSAQYELAGSRTELVTPEDEGA